MDLKEALDTVNECGKGSPNRFNIEFITFDRSRNTGGKLKRESGCQVVGASHDQQAHGTITILPRDAAHPIPVHHRLIMKVNEIPVL